MNCKKSMTAVVAGAAAVALALTGCSGGGGGGDRETVTVGNIPALYWAAWSATGTVLEEEETDADYEIVEFSSSADAFIALRSGDTDITGLGINVMATGLAENPDLGVQMVAGISPGRSQLIVSPDAGITDWDDLKGKNLGIIRGSTDEMIFNIALAQAGIDMASETELTTLQSPADLLLALRNGDIDASVTYQPYTAQAVADGIAEMPEDMNAELTEWASVPTGIFATDELIENDPEAVQEVVDAFVAETEKFEDKEVWVDTALEYQAGDRELLLSAIEDDVPWFYMEEDKIGGMAKSMHEFGATSSDVSGELVDRINYDFLAKATGKTPEELGKSGGE